ncbi:putative ABC transporter permease [Enterococcus faecalis]|uniref:putative ABC transporter permease n=1 Tax=Enterococcus faecalis TaxID=1351 RepID=UPI003D76D6FA
MKSIFMTFIVYSFIGWLWESIYCSIKARHYVYRGFLLGPYCPVYGIGVSSVILLVPEHAGTLLNLYLNIVVIVTLIEFVTSWILEKFFGMKLWDYSKVPFNIEGRVAVPVSLFWGGGCLFLLKIINPIIQMKIHVFSVATANIGPIIIAILFVIDVLTTLIFTLTTKKEVEAIVDTSDPNNAVIKEFRWEHLFSNKKSSDNRERVIELIKNRPMKMKHHNLNRLVRNYPNMSFKNK